MTDIFLPTMMDIGVKHPDWSWVCMMVALKPGVAVGPVQDRLSAVFDTAQRERAKGFTGRPKQFFERFFSWHVRLKPAPAGISNMQEDYRVPLIDSERAGVIGAADCLRECCELDDGPSYGADAGDGACGYRLELVGEG